MFRDIRYAECCWYPDTELPVSLDSKWEPSNTVLITLAGVKKTPFCLCSLLSFWLVSETQNVAQETIQKNYCGLVIMTPYRQHVCVCVCVSLALKVKMHTMFVSAGNKLQ